MQQKKIPTAIKLLRAFCPEQLLEEIEGDLLQKFDWDVRKMGEKQAKRKLAWNTVRFFRPGIIFRNKFNFNLMNSSLISNYLKVALRNLWRNKSYSAITIVSLAVGIACSLVIFLFVHGEWSYDKGFANADRTYRIGISFFNIGQFAQGPEELLTVLPKEFEGIEMSTRIRSESKVPFQIKDQSFTERAYYTDSSYFKVFNYNFLSGNPNSLFRRPNEAVLSTRSAKVFFGRTDVVGETMLVGKKKVPFVVSAVAEPLDFNSHLKTEIWLSNHQLLTNEHAWSSAAFYNYVMLKKQNSEKDLHAALDLLFKNHVYPESGKPMGFKTLEEYAKNDIRIKFYVHKLTDIYLKSKLNFEISPGGNESYIYIFGAVSAFILLLAAINFINLSTARATRRAKEVGIRKTLGTHRLRLIGQFLFESVTTCLLSMMVSILLAELFLRAFEYITGSILLDTIWRSPSTVGIFFAFSLVVGLLSGLYPAFYLTSFIPVKVLKGEISTGARSFRNSLVVFQFTISILLITCALMVQSQLHFMANKELGFDQKNVLTIDHADLLKTSAEAFKNELSKEPGVTVSSFHVGEPGSQRIMSFYVFQSKQMEHPASILTYFGDDKYISLHGMHLVKGRDFNKDLASDSAGIIFNEAAIRELGITGDPVGVTLSEGQKIIGVVQDFHWESMRKAIAPIAIIMNNKKHAELGFKIANTAIPDFIQKAEKKWKELVPDEPFQYHFLDSNFGEFIKKEEVFGRAINIFTILSIFISCIGLYGLSAYTIEQRTKEIGIRKVLGASALSIVTMLNKKFTLLVVIAIIISIPLSIYCIKLWLQEFAYKTEMGSGVFVVTVVLSILMAILTVSYHALKASLVNPSETLKYD